MTETKDNSSLPLLLSITGAVVAVAVGGWFLLNHQSDPPDTNAVVRVESPVGNTADTTADTGDTAVDSPSESEDVESDATSSSEADDDQLRIDTELRKARLAAGADILILPATQSAFFYYSRVLSIDPQHAIAHAELDAILAAVAQDITQHLAAEKYDEAYEIAVLVARQKPEHALVIETQTSLDSLTEDLVQQSITAAQNGNDKQANESLAAALALPGRNPNYFDAIRDSITEIRTVRETAERATIARAQLAKDDARTAWVEQAQAAIAAGNLITPAGASAQDLIAERNSWATERAQLTDELLAALLATAEFEITNNELESAERLLIAATALEGEPNDIESIRAALERAYIEEQSNRVVPVTELVSIERTSPRYPRRAQARNISGWVDVYFRVTPSGNTTNIEIFESEPEATFDRAAISAVEQWIFEPVEYRGQIISQRAAIRLTFEFE